jgi:hypothetical protein
VSIAPKQGATKCRQLSDLLPDEALLLQRKIAMLESPSSRVLNALREWLHGPTRVPNDKSKLAERDNEMFSIKDDLVAIRAPPEKDLLSSVLRDHWPFPAEVIRPLPVS